MRASLFSFFSMLFLLGCGGGGSSSGEILIEEITPRTSLMEEPYILEQWALLRDDSFYATNAVEESASVNASDYLENYRGRGVRIAIIDDGLDTAHEDLRGAIKATYNVATQGTNVSHSDSISFHGTAVTGIVGARVNARGMAGVAGESEILFLKFKDSMSDSEVIELFDAAAAFGADIINNSWGTGNVTPAVRAKIQSLATTGRGGRGVCIVFSAGNDSRDIAGDESSIPEVISVGATNKNNARSGYSNFGANLDIMAPGGEYLGVTTLDVSGLSGGSDGDYLFYDDSNAFVGTSAAAPIVSGIIALMLEKNPNLTRAQIENILKETADKIGGVSYEANGHNDYYGYGKVNLRAIMEGI
jgi:subtilisin family serine protease